MARGSKPYGANVRINRSIVSAWTGSEALTATFHDERSSPSATSGLKRLTHKSNAKFGTQEISPRYSWIAFSQTIGRCTNATGAISTQQAPTWNDASAFKIKPIS